MHSPIHRERDSVALSFDDLGKRYTNGRWGLRHASATLHYGRMTAILGPNGAGKSTLIHMLAQAVQPSEGTYTVADPDARIGWASQRTTIDWYLNALDNVIIGARLAGFDRRQSRERSLQMLEILRLDDQAGNDVSMLSGGQQQRIQVARTLVADPDILLLDEPTASLDIESAESVLSGIRDRARAGAAVLISSHDLGLLERYCDDVMLIANGSIVAHDSLPAFLSRFAPADSMKLRIDGEIPAKMLSRLHQFNPRLESDNVLTITLPPTAALGEIIATLELSVRVLEATREMSSLRDVYLQLTGVKGGST